MGNSRAYESTRERKFLHSEETWGTQIQKSKSPPIAKRFEKVEMIESRRKENSSQKAENVPGRLWRCITRKRKLEQKGN